MSQLFYGSLCLTDILEHAKHKHSAFTKGSNGKIYFNCNLWMNDMEDKYGNILAVQLNPTKETKDSHGRPYIGNFKKSDFAGPQEITDADVSQVNKQLEEIDDLPF